MEISPQRPFHFLQAQKREQGGLAAHNKEKRNAIFFFLNNRSHQEANEILYLYPCSALWTSVGFAN